MGRRIKEIKMEEENGFYKDGGGVLLFSQYVIGPDFWLFLDDKDIYTYPYHDWYYFDTEAEALDFFGLTEDVQRSRV